MPAVKKRSCSSPRGDWETGKPDGERRSLARCLAALRHRPDQEIDQRIDRLRLRKINAALEGRLDQTTDDLGPTDRLSVLETDVDGQAVEIRNVTIEQDDGDLRPRLGMDNRTTAIAFDR